MPVEAQINESEFDGSQKSGDVTILGIEKLPKVSFVDTPYITSSEAGKYTVSVKLSKASKETVTIEYATSDGTATAGGDYLFSSGGLSWTAESPLIQSFDITILEDEIAEEDETIFVTLSHPENCTISKTNPEMIVIKDDDVIAIEVQPETISIIEGSVSQFEVRLTAQPTTNRILAIEHLEGDSDIVIAPDATSFTFTELNWNIFQPVTVRALEDDDPIDGWAILRIKGNQDQLPPVDITVHEVDNDELNLEISPNALNVPEGDTNTFQIRLTALAVK